MHNQTEKRTSFSVSTITRATTRSAAPFAVAAVLLFQARVAADPPDRQYGAEQTPSERARPEAEMLGHASGGAGDIVDAGTHASREPAGVPDPVQPNPDGIDRIRFLSFVVPETSAGQTALRVRLDSIDTPPGAPDGRQVRYVNAFGGPGSSLACPDALPNFPDYPCARLGCEPEYRDWSSELGGTILYVTGDSVVPSSSYLVSNIAASCGAAPDADTCATASAEVPVNTAVWGNITGPGNGPPDDTANILDVSAAFDKAKGLATAFPEPRVWTKHEQPNPVADPINVLDCGFVVDAAKGLSYPFDIEACP